MREILFERREGAAVVTLNRPEARNAITPEMVHELHEFLREIESDRSIRCVLLKGAGEHFMAGGDVKSFAETTSLKPDERQKLFEARVQAVAPLLRTMERMPQILVAAVKGACAGAGVSWVAAADLAIAARSSFFVLAQIRIGVSPDGSGTYWLPRTVGLKRAKQLALLGDRISAEDAERWGLVNCVVDDERFEKTVDDWIGRLAAGPSVALGETKKLLNESLDNSYAIQLQREAEGFSRCTADADFGEGLQAFIAKRNPRFGP